MKWMLRHAPVGDPAVGGGEQVDQVLRPAVGMNQGHKAWVQVVKAL